MYNPQMRLGDILLREGLITEMQLAQALDEQNSKSDQPLGEILVEMGAIDEATLVEFLGKQFNYPFISHNQELLIPDRSLMVEELTSEDFMRRNLVMPLSKNAGVLKVAICDPLNLMLMDNLKVMSGMEISPVVVGRQMLQKAVDMYFNRSESSGAYGQEIVAEDTGNSSGETLNIEQAMHEASEGQVVRIVNLIIMQAVTDGASDIHFEPLENASLQVRYRIDGELLKVAPPPSKLYGAIVSRIKILSRLDISEKRLPQDGAITMKIENRNIDFRVSSIPTIHGEKIVIRILDKGKMKLDIDQLGIDPHSLNQFKEALSKPYGMVLVTGPTGSGKTTTLYSCLNHINDEAKNINTIEDPVEYKLLGVNQIQVRPEIGLTFAAGLRSFLRQDPDVIMLGEIRDGDTAEMSVRAALTGHFVLSTLHTNSAVQSIDRLINMGVEPVMLASSLVLVVAQRLVRKLCEHCKQPYQPEAPIQEMFNLDSSHEIFQPVGCEMCKNLGYKGRLGIHETFLMNDEMKLLIAQNQSTPVLERRAKEMGMRTLRDSCLDKVKQGLTTLDELMAATV